MRGAKLCMSKFGTIWSGIMLVEMRSLSTSRLVSSGGFLSSSIVSGSGGGSSWSSRCGCGTCGEGLTRDEDAPVELGSSCLSRGLSWSVSRLVCRLVRSRRRCLVCLRWCRCRGLVCLFRRRLFRRCDLRLLRRLLRRLRTRPPFLPRQQPVAIAALFPAPSRHRPRHRPPPTLRSFQFDRPAPRFHHRNHRRVLLFSPRPTFGRLVVQRTHQPPRTDLIMLPVLPGRDERGEMCQLQ